MKAHRVRADPIAGRPLPPDFDIEGALASGEIGAWQWDLASGRMIWSETMFRNLRVPADASGDLYRHLLEAVHPDDRDRVAGEFATFREKAGPMRIEAGLASAGPPSRWVVFLGRTELGPGGSPTRMLGITIDSTRRRKVEEASAAALRDSESRLRESNRRLQELAERQYRQIGASRAQIEAIFDNSPDWLTLFRATPDGEFVYADLNRATERAYGLPYQEIVGRRVQDVLGAKQAELPLRLMRECIRTGENQRYVARRTMAGANRSIDVMFVRVAEPLDGGHHIMATARDITDRDEMEERLRRERRLFELVIENTSEGIVVVDKNLRHLIWNPAMERINGEPRSAVLGRTVFEVFPQFSAHPVGDAWRQALSGRRAEIRDYRFFSESRRSEIIYDADFTPLYDRDGAIVGAICILHETTERHRMERLAKLETVAQLTGGVAHDFNNLLTAAMGCLDLILRDSGEPRTASLAASALRAIDRGGQLTQQLLAFARRQALRPVAADLNALLAEIAVLIERAVGETIRVEIDSAPDLPRCKVDPAQFEAAIMNLIINARDAMPNGGTLRLTTQEAGQEQLPAEAELAAGDYVAVSVEDDGEGMAPEVAARALEPFYTTKEVGKGSGLGLSTVYGFAKQSGGGLRLDSAPGGGTRVTLYLPSAGPSDPAMPQPQAPDEAGPGSGTILVAEDNPDVREVSVAMLEDLGYRTLVARDGHQALAVLRGPGRIDLLFTDVAMPGGISGVELARQARDIRPGLRVLLTTGYAGLELAAGEEFPVIPKPFRSAELGRALARLLDYPAG